MKNIILFTAVYFLALMQGSFFVHLRIFGIVPNILVLALLAVILFEGPRERTGVFIAVFAGFLWDIFSGDFIGYHIVILAVSAIAIKIILYRYVRIPTFQRS